MPLLPTTLASTLHLAQLLLSAYATTYSYAALTRLRDYESATRTAADWSKTAEDRLAMTRATHGAGAASLAASLITSAYLFLRDSLLTGRAARGMEGESAAPLVCAGIAGVATAGAAWYVGRYWQGKNKVPFVEKYNEALVDTKRLVLLLGASAGLWAVQTGVAGWRFFG